jgi:hypothetical protein
MSFKGWWMVELNSRSSIKKIQGLFNEHKVDESSYWRNLKRYRKAYLDFQYDSPFVTLEDNFHTLDFN